MPPDAPSRTPRRPPGTLRIGTIAGSDVLVSSSWFLIAGLIAVVMAPAVEQAQPGLGGWKYVAGVTFAVVLYGSVLLHEASHALMARRQGFAVRAITLHFLGGATEIQGESRTPRQEFLIAVVGPLTSIGIGLLALALVPVTPDGLLLLVLQGLVVANLLVGILNLVPGLPLDGGRVLKAGVWKLTGNVHRGTIAAGWGGRVAALAMLLWPIAQPAVLGRGPDVFDYVIAFVIALFLWTGASASIASGRLRAKLPRLVARDLARRTLAVPDDVSVAEAVRRAQEVEAGGIVTVTSAGTPVGIVSEAGLLAMPEDRRPWLPVSAISRSIEPGLTLSSALSGEELVVALGSTPSSEYLVVDDDGHLFGVLSTADVDRAFRSARR